jgi:hypothetical protein
VRAPDRKRPDTLMLPPDDRRLEDIIGSLQSEMGVPQNPQEYRLTVKIAEERDGNHRGHKPPEAKTPNGEANGKPKREKAPAPPPNVGGGDAPSAQREKAPSRKRRSRRRRRGGRSRGGSGGSPGDGGGAPTT